MTSKVEKIREKHREFVELQKLVYELHEQVVGEIDRCIAINPELKGKMIRDFPESFQRINNKWYSTFLQSDEKQREILELLEHKICDMGDGEYFLVPIEDEGIHRLEVMELLKE